MKTILLLLVANFTLTTTKAQYTQNSEGAENTINYTSSILQPVQLVSFSALLNSDVVDLKWTTASEKNVSHFSIEKSTDGINYNQAGVVFAFGNTSEAKNYSFADKNINVDEAGVISYRFRSIYNDGSGELSHIRSIMTGKNTEQGLSVLTYPNPVSNELHIAIPADWQGKMVSYELLTSKGQEVRKNLEATASQIEVMNFSNLTPGLYFLKVSCNGTTAQQKIIKK